MVILLGIAANVAQLLLASATERQREAAVRMALGAERSALARQQLVDTALLTALGCAGGLVLAAWSLRLARALGAVDLAGLGPVRLDWRVFAGAAAFMLATATVCGLGPALAVSRRALTRRLAEGSGRASLSRSHQRFHRLLAVGQMAVAVVLVSAALLVTKSYAHLLAVEPGFAPHGLLTLDLTLPESRYQSPDAVRAFVDRARAELASLPGATGGEPAATFNPVTADYFGVMRIPLLRGRGIGAADAAAGEPVVVIDQALARQFFRGREAVGRTLELTPFPGMPWRIVGVAGSVRQGGHWDPSTTASQGSPY